MLKRANFNHFSNYILANIMDLGCVPIKYFFATGSKSSAFPSKILILRTDGIGDVLVTIPLISSIKEAYPETRIDILIRPKSHEVAKRINAVSEVIVSDTKKSDVMHMLRCRKKGYDLVISPRPDRYIFNHVLSLISGAKRRIGYVMKGGGCILTDAVKWEGEKPIVSLLQDFSEVLEVPYNSRMSIAILPEEAAYVDSLLFEHNIGHNERLVGINPFAAHPFIWTKEYFITLLKMLYSKYSVRIVFLGIKEKSEAIDEMRQALGFPTISLAGKTSLLQLAAAIKRMDALITVDSGPRHIANAVNTPVIVLRNGANSNIQWGSYTCNEILIAKFTYCSPCGKTYCDEGHRICMTTITPDEVAAAADTILRDAKR